MSLLANIPGLSRHDTPAPPLPMAIPPTRFDRLWADRLIENALADVSGCYPAGAMEWIRVNRPDIDTFLKEASLECCQAVLAEDGPRVTQACERFVAAHRRAFQVFEAARVPVIDVDLQLDLLAAVG